MQRLMFLGAMVLLLAGCSGEAALPNVSIQPFKTDPSVSAALQAINGGDVTVKISATNFKALPPADAADKHKYGEGHFHLFLDVLPTPPGEAVPVGVNGVYHTPESTYTIHNVANGTHHLYVELGFSDHLPYQAIADTGGKFHGAIAELDFQTGPNATKVAPPETVVPSAAPSAGNTPATTGGQAVIKVIGEATNGGAYDPATKSVAVGTTVEWDWIDDAASHSVTDDSNKFDSGLKSKGDKFTYKFTSAGTYKYHCSVHPNMLGQVTVQ